MQLVTLLHYIIKGKDWLKDDKCKDWLNEKTMLFFYWPIYAYITEFHSGSTVLESLEND